MLDQALKNVFTLAGLITTLIQVSMIAGILTLYILFQVQVMGRDVMLGSQDYPGALSTARPKK